MVTFEGKAFDEKKVVTIEMLFEAKEIRMDLTNDIALFWHYSTEKKGLSMMTEIVNRINERENEILKIKAE